MNYTAAIEGHWHWENIADFLKTFEDFSQNDDVKAPLQ